MTFFEQQLQVPNQTWTGLRTSIQGRSASCASCIFSTDADTTWGPVVFVGTNGGAMMNYGACLTRSPGGSQACGQKLMQNVMCLGEVCSECTTQQAEDACVSASVANPATCGKYDDTAACGANRDALLNACDGVASIRAMCSGGL